VGAGVSEHSDFGVDPWGRLLRTLDYSYTMSYGSPAQAVEMGARVREMHKAIRGTRPDGKPYHALEPEAYGWVHATLAHSIVKGHELLGRRMPPSQLETFYWEWRRLGGLIGVRDRDLPVGWSAFGEYFEQTCVERLRRTDAVGEVLDALQRPAQPPLRFIPAGLWRIARVVPGRQIGLITAGLLGADLRLRLGVPWPPGAASRLRALAAISRAATPLMPADARNVGPRYLRWRAEQIARGEAAGPAREVV
jgi:uncharacterized protein (DUF2236 family)